MIIFKSWTGPSASGNVSRGGGPEVAFIHVHSPDSGTGAAGTERRKGGEWKVRCITPDRDIGASQRGCRPEIGAKGSSVRSGLYPLPQGAFRRVESP